MKCLDASGDREKLLDLIVEAGLVEITDARVEQATLDKPGAIYCTIQQRKRTSNVHEAQETRPKFLGSIFGRETAAENSA